MSFVKRYGPNLVGRDFVISDLHGCIKEMFALMKHVNFNCATDRLFSVGDLVDRGPYPMETLELLNEKWFFPVLGNHDEMLMMSLLKTDTDPELSGYVTTWMANGGLWFLDAKINQLAVRHYAQKMMDLPLVIHVDGSKHARPFNIVHAELIGNIGLSDSNLESHLPSRDPLLWGRQYAEGRIVLSGAFSNAVQTKELAITYCGHNTVDNIECFLRQINIDTGCAYGYLDDDIEYYQNPRLTLVYLEAGKAYSCAAKTGVITETCLRGTINKLSNDSIKFVAPILHKGDLQ